MTLVLFGALFQAAGFAERRATLRPAGVTPSGAAVYERVAPTDATAPEDAVDALVYTAGTATAIISGPERPLTRAGRAMRVVLRIVGPVLIALLVLSIRGRVKR